MGTRPGPVGRAPGGERRALALAFVTVVAGLLLTAAPARATFHEMLIREVYSGSGSNSSYVELQMYASGQSLVNGHFVRVYNASASPIGTFTFTSNVAKGENQRTILVGDDGVEAAFGSKPDLVNSAFDIPATGGAACFESIDCVSWGSFSGSLPSSAGTPEAAIPAGMAIRRSIGGGTCTGQLDGADDTNNSAADFTVISPQPRNNASTILETSCAASAAPDTAIANPKPASRTNSTSATFTFTATPSAEATFECKLDAEPEFSACTSPKEYIGLAGGTGTSHTFQVRAVHPTNGTDPTPASHTWVVDTVAPTATILTQPPDPGPGNSASFTYSSNEGGSAFQCSLVLSGEPDSFSFCLSSGKTYSGLVDGEYTFKVRAEDPAGNEGAPDFYSWTVDNSLNDVTPPVATIVSKPPNPSTSPNASFTYQSNEPNSTFECKLDDGAFVGCDPTGVSYFGLENGQHSFQVRATDESGNLGSPAGYSWDVAVPAFEPAPISPPAFPELQSAAPRKAPQTVITLKPGAVTRDRTPSFRFRSSPPGASFACKVDRGPFRPCSSPFTTKSLSFRAHTVQVRATAGGIADPTPAKSSFRVAKPKRKRPR
jgi:hypothetical protein